MAYFYIAQDTGWEYYFEVCDDPPGACSHTDDRPSHRIYVWGKDKPMPVVTMITEIKLLEAARLAGLTTPPANPLRVTPRSTPLENQEL